MRGVHHPPKSAAPPMLTRPGEEGTLMTLQDDTEMADLQGGKALVSAPPQNCPAPDEEFLYVRVFPLT